MDHSTPAADEFEPFFVRFLERDLSPEVPAIFTTRKSRDDLVAQD